MVRHRLIRRLVTTGGISRLKRNGNGFETMVNQVLPAEVEPAADGLFPENLWKPKLIICPHGVQRQVIHRAPNRGRFEGFFGRPGVFVSNVNVSDYFWRVQVVKKQLCHGFEIVRRYG